MQVTARASLRDGVNALKARFTSLYHLGVKPVARSTFADANNRRPASFFEALFAIMNQRCLAHAPRHKFKFKNKLNSLDATVVSLCLSLFPWASFRRTKAGVKVHTLLNHDGYLPAWGWRLGEERRLIIVNLSGHRSQALIPLPWEDLAGRTWQLTEAFTGEIYARDGLKLRQPGLFVDLEGWGFHFFRVA